MDSPDTNLSDIDLLDTDLDLLDKDIPSKHCVCLQDILKTSSRNVLKTSSRNVFKTFQVVFSAIIFCLSRSFEELFNVWNVVWKCCKKKKKSKGLSDESIKPPSMYDNSQIIFVVLKHE